MSKADIIYRRVLYILASALPILVSTADQGKPFNLAVWLAVGLSVVVTLRAFEDKSNDQGPDAQPINVQTAPGDTVAVIESPNDGAAKPFKPEDYIA